MATGWKHTDEWKEMMREKMTGKNSHRFGVKVSEETRKKMSESHKRNPARYWLGKKNPEQSQRMKGYKPSAETRKKLSIVGKGRKSWNKGIPMSPEHREKFAKYNKGRKFSVEHRRKMSDAKKGAKSHLWKGGITETNALIRTSFEYKLWRKAVFERDNYICVWCGAHTGNGHRVYLEADHIKSFSEYPELRFAIDNGRTLCKPCHLTTNTHGRNTGK